MEPLLIAHVIKHTAHEMSRERDFEAELEHRECGTRDAEVVLEFVEQREQATCTEELQRPRYAESLEHLD